MIPKIIHYCWFGNNDKPDSVKYCIESWRKHCGDYQIIEWNENNYDVTSTDYIKQAYNKKRWAFVADYVRLDVVEKYGGIYLDTDVELIRNIDFLLHDRAFIGFERIEDSTQLPVVNTGQGFGSEPHGVAVSEMKKIYDKEKFINSEGQENLVPCTQKNTKALLHLGMVQEDKEQSLKDIHVYSSEYFSPKAWNSNAIHVSNLTCSIHHYSSTWLTQEEKKKRKKLRKREKVIQFISIGCQKVIGYKRYKWCISNIKKYLIKKKKMVK